MGCFVLVKAQTPHPIILNLDRAERIDLRCDAAGLLQGADVIFGPDEIGSRSVTLDAQDAAHVNRTLGLPIGRPI